MDKSGLLFSQKGRLSLVSLPTTSTVTHRAFLGIEVLCNVGISSDFIASITSIVSQGFAMKRRREGKLASALSLLICVSSLPQAFVKCDATRDFSVRKHWNADGWWL